MRMRYLLPDHLLMLNEDTGGGGGVTFTQADMDRVAGEARRGARAEADAAKAEAKAAAAAAEAARKELEALKGATASEHEKAILAARDDEGKRVKAEYEAKLAAADAQTRQTKITGKIEALAATKLNDPADALLAYQAGEQTDLITINDKGEVVGVDKWLEELLKKRSHWAKTTANGAPVSGRPGSGTITTAEQEERESSYLRLVRGMH